MSCYICLEDLSSPVSLPCGHVFCHDCLKRAVQAIQPYSTLHSCPTCRSQYHLAPLNLSAVPPQLRPYLTPSIRKVYVDLPSAKSETPGPSTSESSSGLAIEIARLRAENDALRSNCCMWRKRAEVHSAATLGLLELSRTAKDQVLHVARQRDMIQNSFLRLNQDFQRQQALLRAMAAAAPTQGLGSARHIPSPSTGIDHSATLSVKVDASASPSSPTCGSHMITERPRKRLRTGNDHGDYGAKDQPPTKIARRNETEPSEPVTLSCWRSDENGGTNQ